MTYSLDANIISFALNGNESIRNKINQLVHKGNVLNISPIVDYEIRRGLLAKGYSKKLKQFEKFLIQTAIGEFRLNVWRKAAEIYAALSKQGKPIGSCFDGDVFIAAYCVVNGYTLFTNNKNHFGRFDGLVFENWGLQ